MRIPALALVLFSFLLASITIQEAQAQSITPPAVNLEDREAVRVFHNTYYSRSEGIALGFTGNAATFTAGTISTAFRTSALLRTNYYRRLAGLNAVAESTTFDTRAHEAAFLMWTGGDYLFYPPRWASPAWTANAYEGASRSNKAPTLPTGWGSGTDIDGFMQDEGEPNLGADRRHWVLFPATDNMGYGATPGASALYVRENGNDTVLALAEADLNQAQSWPARGFLPAAVPFTRWSWTWISQATVDFSTASISVRRDGTLVPVTVVYRTGRLVWDFPEGEFGGRAFPPQNDITYTVSIRGVVIDGQTRGFDYTVILFSPTVPTTGQAPVVVLSAEEEIIVAAGAPLRLSAEVSDGNVQWFKDDLMLPSQTRTALDITSAGLGDAGRYWVEVRNNAGLVRSESVDVVVIPAGLTAPSITSQPKSSTFTLGTAASLSVTASSPVPISYQWRKGGVDLPGRTLSRLDFSSVTSADAGTYDVVVSNYAGSTVSASARLSVLVPGSPPSITRQPTSYSVDAGTKVVFSVTASSQVAASYQWRKNGVNLAGKTTNTLEIASARLADAGSYDVVVANAYGSVTSQAATLKVVEPMFPSISTQPAAQTIFAGSRAQFYVIAAGPGTLTYQWRKDGVALTGQTASVLVLPVCRTSDSGSYTVAISNEYGTTTSTGVALSVLPTITPLILTHPAGTQATTGSNVTLSVEATGRPTLTYQWRKNSLAISGATKATYSLTNLNSSSAGDYDVVVTNPYGKTTSNTATVTVRDPGIAPSVTTQPSSQTVPVGAPVTFSVAASGTDPLTYQWYKGATKITSGTTATYTIEAATLNDAGNYSVVVGNLDGSVTSETATLTVTERVLAPEVTIGPADLYVHRGDRVSFTVQASGTDLSYQWYLNDTLVPGMTGPTFQAFNAEPYHDTWRFHCVVSNSLGSVTSRTAVLSVWTDDSFLKWATHPVDVVTNLGGSAAFTAKAVAYRGAEVSYRWYLGDTPLAGAGGTTLEFTGVQGYHFTDYHVVASATIDGVVRSLRSDNVWVTANRTAPVVTSEPSDTIAPSGSLVGFRVQATGHPLTYQWYLNDQPVPGFTSSYFPSFSLSETHVGWTFHCVVGNELGSVTTRKARVSIAATPPALYWGAQPADVVSTRGGTATLSCNAIAPSGATIAYEWYMGSTLLTGLTKSYLTINGLADYHFTDYHVVAVATVAGVPYSITSDPVYIRSKPTP